MKSITSTVRNAFSVWLMQIGVALCYLLFGLTVHHFITNHGILSILWPGSGLARAAWQKRFAAHYLNPTS